MAEKLEPCPHCGSEMLTIYRPMQVASGTAKRVICDACGSSANAEVWNRRAPGPATAALVAKLAVRREHWKRMSIAEGDQLDSYTPILKGITIRDILACLAEHEPVTEVKP